MCPPPRPPARTFQFIRDVPLRIAQILRSLLLATLLFRAAALPSPAQPGPADTLRAIPIGEARVSALRRDTLDLVPGQTLEGDRLRSLSALSAANAVRYFSGVQVKDYGGVGGLKTVNIRSMGTHHVGIFYDGIELGNAQNGQVDLGRFSLENLEAVSVYNGQRSRIFQPAKDFGSAGTVYLQSRVPVFAPGRRRNLSFGLKGGSFGLANPSFLWEEKLSPRLSASVSGEYMHANGRYRFRYRTVGGYDTTATRRGGDVGALRAEAGLFGSLPEGTWRAKAYVYRSERGLPGAVVRGSLAHEERQWDTNFFLQGSWQQRLSARHELLVSAKYAYDYLHYLSDPRRDASLMYADNRYRQQEAYASVAQLFSPGRHLNLSVAADYQLNALDANLYRFVRPVRHTLLCAAAAALDYERFRLQGSLLATCVFDRARVDTARMSDRAELTPAVFATVRPFCRRDFSLRAFCKRIFRMPTLNDLYYTFIGNVELRPERADQFDIGLSLRSRRRRKGLRSVGLQADAYCNRVTNKIVAVPASNQFRWTMMNLGKVDILGMEASVDADAAFAFGMELRAKASYTFQRAVDHTDPADAFYGDQIPYVPRHSASLVLGADWHGWGMNYSFLYTGERYDQKANIPENYAPAWYTSDVALSRSFRLAAARCRVAAEVNNLFNQAFEVVKGYPMPGTNFKISLHAQF